MHGGCQPFRVLASRPLIGSRQRKMQLRPSIADGRRPTTSASSPAGSPCAAARCSAMRRARSVLGSSAPPIASPVRGEVPFSASHASIASRP
eukprot:10921085-Heterocapsa_arctica.AAC.1